MLGIHSYHRAKGIDATIQNINDHITALREDLDKRQTLLVALEDKLSDCTRDNDSLGMAFWGDRVADKQRAVEIIEAQIAESHQQTEVVTAELSGHIFGTTLQEFADCEDKEEAARLQQTLDDFAAWRAGDEAERLPQRSFPPLEDVLRPRGGPHSGPRFGPHGGRRHPRFGPHGPCQRDGHEHSHRQDGFRPLFDRVVDVASNATNGSLVPAQEIKSMLDTFLVNLSNQLATTFEGAPPVATAAAPATVTPEPELTIPGAFVNSRTDVQTQTIAKEEVKSDKPSSKLGKGGFRHRHITCDGCLTGIRGMRYKCEVRENSFRVDEAEIAQQCPDYDLCGACLPLLHAAEFHPAEHTFRAILHQGLENRIQLPVQVKEVNVKEAPQAPHWAYCDLCSQTISGVRWKCLNCPDWDCCDSCAATIDETHPGHSFVKLHKASDYVSNDAIDARERVKHPHIICDGE